MEMRDDYIVSGYSTPSGIRHFSTEEEAIQAAKELDKDDWSTVVTVVLHRCIWNNQRR